MSAMSVAAERSSLTILDWPCPLKSKLAKVAYCLTSAARTANAMAE